MQFIITEDPLSRQTLCFIYYSSMSDLPYPFKGTRTHTSTISLLFQITAVSNWKPLEKALS